MSNGTPKRVMGNGEGMTCLLLTDAESRLIRDTLTENQDSAHGTIGGLAAYNRGIQRATDRIKAEFDDEQKRRKEAKK